MNHEERHPHETGRTLVNPAPAVDAVFAVMLVVLMALFPTAGPSSYSMLPFAGFLLCLAAREIAARTNPAILLPMQIAAPLLLAYFGTSLVQAVRAEETILSAGATLLPAVGWFLGWVLLRLRFARRDRSSGDGA